MTTQSEKQAQSSTIVFGLEKEWHAFGAKHSEFLQRFPNIVKAADAAFQRTFHSTELLGRTLYFLGRLVWEEFMEVLLLSANGYGIGALKLVRGMYERAVTARYLREHPDEVDNYLAFHKVAEHKLLKSGSIEHWPRGLFASTNRENRARLRGSKRPIYGSRLPNLQYDSPESHLEQTGRGQHGSNVR
jgi:hypothetical protein